MTAYITRVRGGDIFISPTPNGFGGRRTGPVVKVNWTRSDVVRTDIFGPSDDEYRELDAALRRFERGLDSAVDVEGNSARKRN